MTEFEIALINEMRTMAENMNEMKKKINELEKKVDSNSKKIDDINRKVNQFEEDIEKFKQAHTSLAKDAIKKNEMIVDIIKRIKKFESDKEEIRQVKEDTEKIIRHLTGILTLSRIQNQVRNGVEKELISRGVLSNLREVKQRIEAFSKGVVRAKSDAELARSIRLTVNSYDTKIEGEKLRRQWAKAENKSFF